MITINRTPHNPLINTDPPTTGSSQNIQSHNYQQPKYSTATYKKDFLVITGLIDLSLYTANTMPIELNTLRYIDGFYTLQY